MQNRPTTYENTGSQKLPVDFKNTKIQKYDMYKVLKN